MRLSGATTLCTLSNAPLKSLTWFEHWGPKTGWSYFASAQVKHLFDKRGPLAVGTLKLQVADDVVFAHFLPADAGPNNGGYLGRVYPGGHFKGIGFEELRSLGTGRHSVAVNERVQSASGREPDHESDWRRLFEQFEFALFMYGVGACVALKVLSVAREVVRLESQQQGHAESGDAPDPVTF